MGRERCLVSDEQTGALGAVVEPVLVVEVLLPARARLERLAVVQVEHDEAKVRGLVVHMGHVDVALLAADVPELQVERTAAVLRRLDLFRAELDAHRGLVSFQEDVVDVP